jgi:hypothetical protein
MTTDAMQFPCDISIKVMGLAAGPFEQAVYAAISPLIPGWSHEQVKKKLSRDGKYLSLTILVYAPDRDYIDSIYRALSTCPEVLVAL